MATKKTESENHTTPAQAPVVATPAEVNRLAHPLYDIVSKQPFFIGLAPTHLLVLTESAIIMQFEADEKIFAEGDQANRFYLILEGKVSLEVETEDRRTIPIKTLGPGEDLGWSWLFPPHQIHFAARTLEPTRVILFYGTRLRQQCDADHDFGYEIMKRIAAVMMERLEATRKSWLKTQILQLPANWEFGIY